MCVRLICVYTIVVVAARRCLRYVSLVCCAFVYHSAGLLIVCTAYNVVLHGQHWLAPLCRVIRSVFRPEFRGILAVIFLCRFCVERQFRHAVSFYSLTVHSQRILIWISLIHIWFYILICFISCMFFLFVMFCDVHFCCLLFFFFSVRFVGISICMNGIIQFVSFNKDELMDFRLKWFGFFLFMHPCRVTGVNVYVLFAFIITLFTRLIAMIFDLVSLFQCLVSWIVCAFFFLLILSIYFGF